MSRSGGLFSSAHPQQTQQTLWLGETNSTGSDHKMWAAVIFLRFSWAAGYHQLRLFYVLLGANMLRQILTHTSAIQH